MTIIFLKYPIKVMAQVQKEQTTKCTNHTNKKSINPFLSRLEIPIKAFSGVVFRVFRVAGAPGLPVFVVISWV
jgi:hypothetical protein